jgi:hypothetical protein
LDKRTKNGLPFSVTSLDGDLKRATTCDLILFGTASDSKKVLSTKSPILSVGSGTCSESIDVCLEKKSNRLAIKLHREKLQDKGYKISSELLQIAEIE